MVSKGKGDFLYLACQFELVSSPYKLPHKHQEALDFLYPNEYTLCRVRTQGDGRVFKVVAKTAGFQRESIHPVWGVKWKSKRRHLMYRHILIRKK